MICEGILHSDRYGAMLRALRRDHRGVTSVFYLDVSFAETVRRHARRPQSAAFSAADMRSWYVEHDVLGTEDEQVIDETSAFATTVARVRACLPPPAAAEVGAETWPEADRVGP